MGKFFFRVFDEFQNAPVQERLVVGEKTYIAVIIHRAEPVDYRKENFFLHDGVLARVVVPVHGAKGAVVVAAVLRFYFDCVKVGNGFRREKIFCKVPNAVLPDLVHPVQKFMRVI